MPVSITAAVDALSDYAGRFCALASESTDPSKQVSGLDWTVHDMLAHLAGGAVAYRQMAQGGPSPYPTIEGRRITNGELLGQYADATTTDLLATIRHEVPTICDAVVTSSHAQLCWHGGVSLSRVELIGSLVGEFMIHGLDLARTFGRPWPMERADSFSVVAFFNAITPHVIDQRSAKNITASFAVRYRGYGPALFEFDRGTLTVHEGVQKPADVTLSVDPVAFLLVGYGRRSLGRAIATGEALSWGRKPWLGLRFASLFETP